MQLYLISAQCIYIDEFIGNTLTISNGFIEEWLFLNLILFAKAVENVQPTKYLDRLIFFEVVDFILPFPIVI